VVIMDVRIWTLLYTEKILTFFDLVSGLPTGQRFGFVRIFLNSVRSYYYVYILQKFEKIKTGCMQASMIIVDIPIIFAQVCTTLTNFTQKLSVRTLFHVRTPLSPFARS